MNNKQVPEEKKNQIEAAAADAIPILSEEEYRKGWHEESYFHYQQALSLERSTFRIGAEYGYSLASLPAEPSTPETKDKPATGLGGGGEAVSKERFLREINHIVETGCNDIRLGELYDRFYPGQPTGTVYVSVSVEEETAAKGNIPSLWIYVEQIGQYVKQVQFLPEREEVWDAAITLANNICVQISDEYNNDDRTFEADAATNCAKKIRTALGQSQTFLSQSTGEGINE